ncbi:MAG: ABC transporter permease [Balneolaceae bacterium]
MIIKPPKVALNFLRWFCKKEFIEEIEGDLIEVFEKECESSVFKAKLKFSLNVFRYLRPAFIKSIKQDYQSNSGAMIRHGLLMSVRKSMRYKSTFLINVLGLSTGLACAILILLWVNHERSVDTFHENDEYLYQVIQNSHRADGISTNIGTPAPLHKVLPEEIPQIEFAVATRRTEGMLSYESDRFRAKGLYASKDFFNAFSYPILQGDPRTMLPEKNTILLSESLAEKFFDSGDHIIGKVLEGNRDLLSESFIVSGIFENPPLNSTQQFDFIINFEMALDKISWINDWQGDEAKTFVTLKNGIDVEQFNKTFEPFIKSKPGRENNSLFLQQYSQKYLFGNYENGRPLAGRIIYIRLFTIVALFILAIACINFMNLSTAQASRKMKEIGVKKAIGANKGILIIQFLIEAIMIASISMLLALLMVELILPYFNEIIGRTLSVVYDLKLVITVLCITTLLGIISGSYPAFYLSSFSPILVLKGRLDRSMGEKWIRKGLVVVQFTISVIFITSFLVIHKQIEFVQTKDLGYSRDNVIYFQNRGNPNQETFLRSLKDITGVENATNIYGGSIVNMGGSGRGFSWEGMNPNENIVFQRPHVGYDFVETLDIELIEGRTFSREYGDESTKLIINQATADIIGKEEVVGTIVIDSDVEKEVIGVVKNFNIESLHNEIRPAFIRFSPRGSNIMVKLRNGSISETIAKIEALYNQFNPMYPFDFTFIDDEYQAQYVFEERISVLSTYFTSIAIIISCLGLFGLTTFTAERRQKEIGIRKVLGASEFTIVRLLSGDFTKLVLVSVLIAVPISFGLASVWLESFAYRIELNWWIFVSAGIGAIITTWLTIGIQTLKTAKLEPVQCIKIE